MRYSTVALVLLAMAPTAAPAAIIFATTQEAEAKGCWRPNGWCRRAQREREAAAARREAAMTPEQRAERDRLRAEAKQRASENTKRLACEFMGGVTTVWSVIQNGTVPKPANCLSNQVRGEFASP